MSDLVPRRAGMFHGHDAKAICSTMRETLPEQVHLGRKLQVAGGTSSVCEGSEGRRCAIVCKRGRGLRLGWVPKHMSVKHKHLVGVYL